MFGIADTVEITGGTINSIQNVQRIDTLDKVNEISKVDNVSIKAFPCPKVNDKGLTGAWWWMDKIAIAVSIWATAETWKAAKEEYKIAKQYYDLAKEQWDFFYNFYRPLEQQELSEIWAEQPYTPDYSAAISGHTAQIAPAFAQAEQHRKSLAAKYCLCGDVSQFVKSEITQSTTFGDSANFARRYAEKLAQEKNDIRWQRRIAAASRGRGLLSASASFASKAAGFFSDYAQAMGGLASSAMAFSGYIRNRRQTEYNPVRQRVNGRADVPDTYRGFDAQGYWATHGVMEDGSRGGLSWDNHGGNAPFMQTGFDPSGYAAHSSRP